MREFIKSIFSFSWAMSLFGIKQLGGTLAPGDSAGTHQAASAFDSVAQATAEQLGDALKNGFRTGDRLQRAATDALFGSLPAGQAHRPTFPTSSAQASSSGGAARVYSGRLNSSSFIVLGEGLAAGMGDFVLSEETQSESFPALMARQMQTPFPQPLIQSPGIGNPVGFAELPVLIPSPPQTTVFYKLPPSPVNNLSVPGYRLADALGLRPAEPLVWRQDAKQTACNLILGILSIAYGEKERLPTQLEYALQRRPTLALVELGYYETVEAAVKGDARLLPSVQSFRDDYARLVRTLRETGAELLLLTIPDPLDTAHFSTIATAAQILKLEPAIIPELYGVHREDLITVNGLHEIGFQMFSRSIGPLPGGSVLSTDLALEVSRRVRELNADIIALALEEPGTSVYDLHGLFRRLKDEGIAVGQGRLTAEYLGGFYSLNGYYPGATGHAIIANELLHFLNLSYGADFPQIDVQATSLTDPVAAYRQAAGPNWTNAQPPHATPPAPVYAQPAPAFEGGARTAQTMSGWEELGQPQGYAGGPLRLPHGLEQVLPLARAASYFGDGIGAMNCRDERSIQWGSCGQLLFGGLAMVDSHLSGSLRIRFTEPVNHLTRFAVSFNGGLVGDDAVLCAPRLFKMAFQQSRVDEVPGMTSSGTLNLATGEVTDLKVYARYSSSALMALVSVNPNFPQQPLGFPGPYGSAWARFEQRSDGLLDFTFYGSTFVPLGDNTRWPLNFFSATQQFATVPANGTVMHPHLHLSTKAPEATPQTVCPDIPFNTLQELTLFTHNSSFGDAFTLQTPELGGRAKGRSHVLGRALLQFGERAGDSVPVAVSFLSAGGEMAELQPSPITEVFPGRLSRGPHGFDEFLRFPMRTYSLDDLAVLDDPFDISLGMIDLKTGRFINELLHRGFINQDLIFALLRVEPRTPKDSFFFRGPAALETGAGGGLLFRFEGVVRVPYPEGFLFPKPNLTTGFTVGPNSVLDPFLWIHAIQDDAQAQLVKRGGARNVLASAGELFSYSYEIPSDPARHTASFEYENHTQQGRFSLHSLAWVGFSQAGSARSSGGDYDTVTFAGFGVWRKDGVERVVQAAVQISTSPERNFVGIQIDSGDVSNVNTKPEKEKDAVP
jgi:hypothetical protein